MEKCLKCGTTEAIVHSGVDAFYMGVVSQIEKICYECANLTINKDVIEVSQ
jgi:uncharacterized membrane protein YhfC